MPKKTKLNGKKVMKVAGRETLETSRQATQQRRKPDLRERLQRGDYDANQV